MLERSSLWMTQSKSTLQKAATFFLKPSSRYFSVRRTSTSGWIPTLCNSFTLCCVGLVFSSPAALR